MRFWLRGLMNEIRIIIEGRGKNQGWQVPAHCVNYGGIEESY